MPTAEESQTDFTVLDPNLNRTFRFTPRSAERILNLIYPIRWRLLGALVVALGASVTMLAIPQVLRSLVNQIHAGTSPVVVYKAAALVLLLGLLAAIMMWLRRIFAAGPATEVERDMRVKLYERLQWLPVSFHNEWSSGQLLSRATTDVSGLRRWVSFGLIIMVNSALTIILGTVLLLSTNWILALVFIVGCIPVTYVSFRFMKEFQFLARAAQDQAGELATTVEQSVQGIRVLKAFGRGGHALEQFMQQASTLRDMENRKAKATARYDGIIIFFPEVTLGICLLLALFLAAQNKMDVGGIAAFFATAGLITGPVRMLGGLMGQTINTKTAVDRMFDIFNAQERISSPENPIPLPLAECRGELTFKAVEFKYDDAREGLPSLLQGVDLEVKPGETMALIGETGSGKSTLLELIPRLYDVTGGQILIDGIDIRDLDLRQLRTLTAIAFEDATLFSDTVKENVLMGVPAGLPAAESKDLLEESLRVADAEFVFDLPEGVDTPVGEEGMSLSGGQRQRLALARAIAAKPKILLLDDPLSALDTKTEELVTARLREVLDGTTTLLVAHRTSTVALADRVALLREGRVVDVGTHQELMARSEYYRFVITTLDEKTARDKDLSQIMGNQSEEDSNRG